MRTHPVTSPTRLGAVKSLEDFHAVCSSLGIELPAEASGAGGSPLAEPAAVVINGKRPSNRIVIHPMEGWDGTATGGVTDEMRRRWHRFGESGAENDTTFQAERYRPLLDLVQPHDNCEVMIMISRGLNALDPERRCDGYYRIAEWLIHPGIVHPLEASFVPWATPYEPWLLWQLAQHPTFVGGKISTLEEPHFLYWAAMCRDLGLDFSPHSGDDFGIATAIKFGLPLLIGAAVSAAPLICAAKVMWLNDDAPGKRFPADTGRFDTRVYKLFESIQSLEDQVFRLDGNLSAAAYKHSTAHVLHELDLIASPETHPACQDLCGADEAARMTEALRRPAHMAARLGIPFGPAQREAGYSQYRHAQPRTTGCPPTTRRPGHLPMGRQRCEPRHRMMDASGAKKVRLGLN